MFPDLLAPRATGIPATVYQRGRGIGGSSAVNAMVALPGSESLYRGWGWSDCAEAWSRVQIPAELAATSELGAVDQALLCDDRAEPLKLTRQNGKRVTSAEAYLWPVLDRPNLTVRSEAPVARICIDARRATGVVLDDGSELEADHVVVCAGAIHSPVILLRSGVDTPGIGSGLQDHPSVVFTLRLREEAHHASDGLPIASALHASVGSDVLQLLPMSHIGPARETAGLGAMMAALMTPTSRAGSVGISRSGTPVVNFALLDNAHDMLIVGIELRLVPQLHHGFEVRKIATAALIQRARTLNRACHNIELFCVPRDIPRICQHPANGTSRCVFKITHPAGNPGLTARDRDRHIIDCYRKNLVALGKSLRHNLRNRFGVDFQRINIERPQLGLLGKKLQ